MLENITPELMNLVITIICGVVVYILSQWYTEFILRPIQDYKLLKAKASKLLILYAQYYSNPWVNGNKGDSSAWSEAANSIRELASEVAAFAEIKPVQLFVFFAIPSKKALLEASKNLIGLSNSFFTSQNSTFTINCTTQYQKNAKKCLRILKSEEKKGKSTRK